MALITIAEAAKMCGVTAQTIINWGLEGRIDIKKKKKNGGKWWYADKEQIEEICSTSCDIEEMKLMLKQEQKDLRERTKRVIESNKQALIDLGIVNTKYMQSSRYLLESIIKLVFDCDGIRDRENKILTDFINGKTLEEVSEEMGVGRERIRQLFRRACRMIRNASVIIDKINDYDYMKSQYDELMKAGMALKKENEELRERFDIKVAPDKEAYLNSNDDVCRLLTKRLEDCDLSVRALNCIRGADIETIGDLVQYSRTDLLKFRNFGKKSLFELDDFIASLGLDFGMDVEKLYAARAKIYFKDNDENLNKS